MRDVEAALATSGAAVTSAFVRIVKTIQSFVTKRKGSEQSAGLRELSKSLRSELVPAPLREAAQAIANLLDGADASASGPTKGGIVINVSVAVAVGAPGKEPGEDESGAGPTPNEAVVIASAIASGAPVAKPPTDAQDSAESEGNDGKRGAEA